MMKDEEKELLKNSWRIVVALWLVIATVSSGLYAAGFLDLPATARSVENIQSMVTENKIVLGSMSKKVGEFNTEKVLRKSRQIYIERRLKNIERQQIEQRRDTKEILRLLISKP